MSRRGDTAASSYAHSPVSASGNRLDQYRIVREIGEGGFGRVFQAEHKLLGEYACLKQNRERNPEHVELLRREAKVIWRLYEHHSIPSAKDFFIVEEDSAVLVTSYIDGETLEGIVKRNGRLHPEDASWMAERLLGALHYCHYNGVIHSDVKPQNLFVEEKKHDIKLIDFGLSVYRPTHATTPTGNTPLYAAPELTLGKPPLPQTDLYGAGIVLLYALGGDVLSKSFPPDTPRELADFGKRLLRYDPQERPCWDENLIETISDIRLRSFGRRHTSG